MELEKKDFCKILGDNNITRVNLIELIEDIYIYMITELLKLVNMTKKTVFYI